MTRGQEKRAYPEAIRDLAGQNRVDVSHVSGKHYGSEVFNLTYRGDQYKVEVRNETGEEILHLLSGEGNLEDAQELAEASGHTLEPKTEKTHAIR